MHVISDEEIIEDAVFDGHFKALTPPLRIDLCPFTSCVSRNGGEKTNRTD